MKRICSTTKSSRNERLIEAYLAGTPIRHLAADFGIGVKRIDDILRNAGVQRERFRHNAPPPQARVWCKQCERSVVTAEADLCAYPWCKAKAVAA